LSMMSICIAFSVPTTLVEPRECFSRPYSLSCWKRCTASGGDIFHLQSTVQYSFVFRPRKTFFHEQDEGNAGGPRNPIFRGRRRDEGPGQERHFLKWFEKNTGTPDDILHVIAPIYAMQVSNGGGFSRGGRFRLTWTNVLIALNVAVFALQMWVYPNIPALFAKNNYRISAWGEYYRLFTAMFVHANAIHLLVNMLSLRNVGPMAEIVFGPIGFPLVYFGSGLAGSYLSYMRTPANAVGASGAIFGLVSAVWYFVHSHRDRRAVGAAQVENSLLSTVVMNLLFGFAARNIDNWNHIGGLLGGVLSSFIVSYTFQQRRLSPQQQIASAVDEVVHRLPYPIRRQAVRANTFLEQLIQDLRSAVRGKKNKPKRKPRDF